MDAPAALSNIALFLPNMARRQSDAPAVVVQRRRGSGGAYDYCRYTFEELNRESDWIAWGLEAHGITRGTRTVLMVRPSLDFFALTFALFKAGAAPILVDPGMGVRNLKACLEEAQPEAFIGIPKAQVARLLFGWARDSIRTCVTVGPRLFWGGATLAQIRAAGKKAAAFLPSVAAAAASSSESRSSAGANARSLSGDAERPFPAVSPDQDEIAAILFTSGSTGAPKGAVYTHDIFSDQVECLREVYGIAPGERDVSTFPLFALFGLALGMTSIVPDMDAARPARASPRHILGAVRDWNATNMFASPALIDRVGKWASGRGVRLPSLKRVISAGAPADPVALARFSEMLEPEAEVFSGYGATEALPVSSIGSRELLSETAKKTDEGGGVCVGRPVPRVKAAVIRITDDPIPRWSPDLLLPPGEIGEIVVKGRRVTRAYFNRPEATDLAKIDDPVDGGFYHRMGDVGYLDESGRLWFCGRKCHRVATPEGDLYTIPCERVFDTHTEVFRTALVGVEREGAVLPVLCVELETGVKRNRRALKRIRDELLSIGVSNPKTRSIKTVLFHDRFPVDIRHNAKILREKLAARAQRRLGDKR
ncbi:MAG TPA: fatty acid CoA ligase family protein [Sumerlaeia bacterium]|nr:fatty acid CoA ligase family protein [Sumerlaeia bacterium]